MGEERGQVLFRRIRLRLSTKRIPVDVAFSLRARSTHAILATVVGVLKDLGGCGRLLLT